MSSSMPVDRAVMLAGINLDETTAARPAAAGARLRLVNGAMRSAHQPLPGVVKELVRLIVHFHRDMGAAVQVGVGLIPKAYGKGTTSPALVNHLKGDRRGAVDELGRTAKSNAKDRAARTFRLRHG